MDRRWIGLWVVTVVLMAALVVGRLFGPDSSGMAVAAPPPGPPTVGDCLLSRDGVTFFYVESVHQGGVPLPHAEIAGCTGPRFGEVVSVVTDLEITPVSGTVVADYTACDRAADRHLGRPDAGSARPVQWWPSSLRLALVSGPDERQRAVGQSWTACLLTVGWDVLDPTVPDDQVQVSEGFENGYRTPELRDRLGLCATGPSSAGEVVPCDQPHEHESFAHSVTGAETTLTEVERSCADLAAQLTGLADPTADDRLTVWSVAVDPDGTVWDEEQVPTGSFVSCGVSTTGTGRLVGSLIGLSGEPIPWQ